MGQSLLRLLIVPGVGDCGAAATRRPCDGREWPLGDARSRSCSTVGMGSPESPNLLAGLGRDAPEGLDADTIPTRVG